jgi:hypothetical protein
LEWAFFLKIMLFVRRADHRNCWFLRRCEAASPENKNVGASGCCRINGVSFRGGMVDCGLGDGVDYRYLEPPFGRMRLGWRLVCDALRS